MENIVISERLEGETGIKKELQEDLKDEKNFKHELFNSAHEVNLYIEREIDFDAHMKSWDAINNLFVTE